MLRTWRVLEPLPRVSSGTSAGGISRAGLAPVPGAEQSATSQAPSASTVKREPAGT